jgi:hypothetical protein
MVRLFGYRRSALDLDSFELQSASEAGWNSGKERPGPLMPANVFPLKLNAANALRPSPQGDGSIGSRSASSGRRPVGPFFALHPSICAED